MRGRRRTRPPLHLDTYPFAYIFLALAQWKERSKTDAGRRRKVPEAPKGIHRPKPGKLRLLKCVGKRVILDRQA